MEQTASPEVPQSDTKVLKINAQTTPTERKQEAEDLIKKGVAALRPLASHLEEFYVNLPVEAPDGEIWQSPTKVIRPQLDEQPGRRRPLILYFYGGGFMVGNPDLVTSPAREWAEQFHATVILPSYRLMPESRFPVPMTDAISAINKIAAGWAPDAHRAYFGANPQDGFVIGGISAGATVAGVAAGLALFGDGSYPKPDILPSGIFLCTPWFFRSENIPAKYRTQWTAMKDNEMVNGFTTANMDAIFDSLQVHDVKSPLLTPAAFFQNGARPTSPWPRTYLQACQYDPLRDDAVIFEKMLAGLGTQTRLRIFPDDVHAGISVLPFIHKSKNPTIEEDTMDGMAWLLQVRQ